MIFLKRGIIWLTLLMCVTLIGLFFFDLSVAHPPASRSFHRSCEAFQNRTTYDGYLANLDLTFPLQSMTYDDIGGYNPATGTITNGDGLGSI
jgi:hypothetical protein